MWFLFGGEKVMNKNFLLGSDLAEKLYTDSAKNLPIADWHNHLSVSDIINDTVFDDITRLWIKNDPYKHRAMRICGVEERYITGDADNYEKFLKWSETLEKIVGNPLYIWSCMELERIFGITEPLGPHNAARIWNITKKALSSGEMSNNCILDRFNIKYNAPCFDITDDETVLSHIKGCCPSLRADRVIFPTGEFAAKLAQKVKIKTENADDYFSAIEKAIEMFFAAGCRIADHSLDDGFIFCGDDGKNSERLSAVINGTELEKEDKMRLASYILCRVSEIYAKKNMTMLLHIGAQRRTSDRLFDIAGAAGGYAAIGTRFDVNNIIALLRDIEKNKHGLPKTILIPLNPSDAAAVSVLAGSFSKDGVSSVVSEGPAWWWCDHTFGIKNVLESVNAYSVLSEFVGMTTDSRSILSFVRHDYFRRILCSFVAEKSKSGEMPDDFDALCNLVRKISYENSAKIFKPEGEEK